MVTEHGEQPTDDASPFKADDTDGQAPVFGDGVYEKSPVERGWAREAVDNFFEDMGETTGVEPERVLAVSVLSRPVAEESLWRQTTLTRLGEEDVSISLWYSDGSGSEVDPAEIHPRMDVTFDRDGNAVDGHFAITDSPSEDTDPLSELDSGLAADQIAALKVTFNGDDGPEDVTIDDYQPPEGIRLVDRWSSR